MTKSVILLVPVSEYVVGEFLISFADTLDCLRKAGWETGFMLSNDVPLDKARQNAWDDVVNKYTKFDYALWLDSDMLIKGPQALELLEFMERTPNVDATSGLYFKKSDGHQPVLYQAFPNEEESAKAGRDEYNFANIMPQVAEPMLVDAVGLGCMAVKMSSYREKVVPMIIPNEKIFRFDRISEDLNFCSYLKRAKMNLCLLPYIEVPHFGMSAVGWCFTQYNDAKKNFKQVDMTPDKKIQISDYVEPEKPIDGT